MRISVQLDLQRRRADQPGELRLGLDLLGHEVEEPDPQRPDVLPRGAVSDMTMTPSRVSTSKAGRLAGSLIGIGADLGRRAV